MRTYLQAGANQVPFILRDDVKNEIISYFIDYAGVEPLELIQVEDKYIVNFICKNNQHGYCEFLLQDTRMLNNFNNYQVFENQHIIVWELV